GSSGPRTVGSQSKRDLRSGFSTDVSVCARNCSDRMAAAAEAGHDRLLVCVACNALSTCLFSRTQDLLRILVLERAKMATTSRSLVSRLSLVQSLAGCVARALSSATLPALPVWGGAGLGECATRSVTADDRLFSPALTRIAAAEYCRQCFAGSSRGSGTSGLA